MSDFDRFVRSLDANGVQLTPNQSLAAEAVLSSDALRVFFMGGLSSGRTFVMGRIEAFCDEERKAGAHAG